MIRHWRDKSLIGGGCYLCRRCHCVLHHPSSCSREKCSNGWKCRGVIVFVDDLDNVIWWLNRPYKYRYPGEKYYGIWNDPLV